MVFLGTGLMLPHREKTRTIAQFLEETPWMRALPSAVRDQVFERAYETVHDEHDLVARRGELARSWMGVMEGLLKVVGVVRSGKAVIYGGIPAGSWVGVGSAIRSGPRRYDMVAARPSRMIHVPVDLFHHLMEASVEFDRFVIDHLNERLSQFMAMVEMDRMEDPVARLCVAIVWLYNPVLYPGMPALIDLSQAELGELAGLTRQRTNAAIRQLAAAGLVEVRYGGLCIKDFCGLQRMANDRS